MRKSGFWGVVNGVEGEQPLPVDSEHILLLHINMSTNQEAPLDFVVQSFVWGFITEAMLTSSPFLPGGLVGSEINPFSM